MQLYMQMEDQKEIDSNKITIKIKDKGQYSDIELAMQEVIYCI